MNDTEPEKPWTTTSFPVRKNLRGILQALRHPVRALPRLYARGCRAGAADREGPGQRLPLHQQGQSGGRDHRPAPRSSASATWGALASEAGDGRQGILFKRSPVAGIDVFDIEVAAPSVASFIETVVNISPTFGGINLEDIAAPHCFEIEEALKARLDIPVFHDDQHGTAVVMCAGLLNALECRGKKLGEIKLTCLGAGAAGLACMRLADRHGRQQGQHDPGGQQGRHP